jgi:hypothetical protein
MSGSLDLRALLRAAEAAALAGGAIVAERFGSTGNAHEKAPGDWVSEADTTSESAVRDALERHAPGCRSSARKAAARGVTSGGSSTRSTGQPTFCTVFPLSVCRSGSWTTASRWLVSCTRLCSVIRTSRAEVQARSGTAR